MLGLLNWIIFRLHVAFKDLVMIIMCLLKMKSGIVSLIMNVGDIVLSRSDEADIYATKSY